MDLLAVMDDTLGLSQEARDMVQRIILLFEEIEKIRKKRVNCLAGGIFAAVLLEMSITIFFVVFPFPDTIWVAAITDLIGVVLTGAVALPITGGILGYFIGKMVYSEEVRMLGTYFHKLKENFGQALMVEALEFIDAHRPGRLALGRKEFKEEIARFRRKKYRASLRETPQETSQKTSA